MRETHSRDTAALLVERETVDLLAVRLTVLA